jgi:hypothetical protein
VTVDKWIKVDLQCNQAEHPAKPNLESEKDMQHLIEALIKDLTEQLRPMVAEMVRQELANAEGENAMQGIAQNIDLADLAREIDLADLAREIETNDLAEKIDISDAVAEFFRENTFSIRP